MVGRYATNIETKDPDEKNKIKAKSESELRARFYYSQKRCCSQAMIIGETKGGYIWHGTQGKNNPPPAVATVKLQLQLEPTRTGVKQPPGAEWNPFGTLVAHPLSLLLLLLLDGGAFAMTNNNKKIRYRGDRSISSYKHTQAYFAHCDCVKFLDKAATYLETLSASGREVGAIISYEA